MRNSKIMVVVALIIGIAVGASVTYVYEKVTFYDENGTLLFYVNAKELAIETSDLHLVLVKRYSTLRDELEGRIPAHVKVLRNLYAARHFNNADATEMQSMLRPNWETQRSEMVGSFALLYGLNQKFPIKKWRSDPALMQELGQAAKARPEYVKWLRCQDWSKPMWVGNEECSGKR